MNSTIPVPYDFMRAQRSPLVTPEEAHERKGDADQLVSHLVQGLKEQGVNFSDLEFRDDGDRSIEGCRIVIVDSNNNRGNFPMNADLQHLTRAILDSLEFGRSGSGDRTVSGAPQRKSPMLAPHEEEAAILVERGKDDRDREVRGIPAPSQTGWFDEPDSLPDIDFNAPYRTAHDGDRTVRGITDPSSSSPLPLSFPTHTPTSMGTGIGSGRNLMSQLDRFERMLHGKIQYPSPPDLNSQLDRFQGLLGNQK